MLGYPIPYSTKKFWPPAAMGLHSKPEGQQTWGISDQRNKKKNINSKVKDFYPRSFPPGIYIL